jgi:diaminopimelate epimerase
MRYYNSDGGEAEMCGNGARCFARFAARLMDSRPDTISFETQAGLITAVLEGELVTLEMGRPQHHRDPQSLTLGDSSHQVHFINTGVPHAVVFVSEVEKIDVQNLGSALRWHLAFSPKGTNANFAQVIAPDTLLLRTYERGVEGETLACGTGVCATALLHAVDTGAESPIHVKVRGGDTLRVDFQKNPDGSFAAAKLTGPADFVFEGTISL